MRFRVAIVRVALLQALTLSTWETSVAGIRLDLFAGRLRTTGGWTAEKDVRISAVADGLVFEATRVKGKSTVRCAVPIPADWRGKSVQFEFALTNLSSLAWGNAVRLAQYDGKGEVLPESVTDPRFMTMMRPAHRAQTFSERGRIHPEAASVALVCGLMANDVRYGTDGLPLAKPADALPRLKVTRLSLKRCPGGDGFPVNPKFFTKGVAGEALALQDGCGFFYATRSQAVWAEGWQERRADRIFWPVGDGTVEAWIRPKWKGSAEAITIFEASNHSPGQPYVSGSVGAVFNVTYRPAEGKVSLFFSDLSRKTATATADAALPEGVWSHLAVAWDELATLYVNGKPVLEVPLAGLARPDLSVAGDPNLQGAIDFNLGGTYFQMRVNEEFPRSETMLRGAVDDLRVSSIRRYRGDFKPVRGFVLDRETRALFRFDKSYDGVSGGGIGWISGSLLAKEPRVLYGGRLDLQPDLDPRKVFNVLNFPDPPRTEDFGRMRSVKSFRFRMKNGDRTVVDCPEETLPDSVEIANRGTVPVLYPLLRRTDEVDTRSFDGIRRTLALDGLTDREKADRVFQFVDNNQDYFMNNAVTYVPGTDWAASYHNDPLLQLNGYPGCSCGGLNYVAAHTFTQSAGLPASAQGGYGHLFQQVYYDGRSRLYDASWQYFCPHFDNRQVARLDDVEREPGMMRRLGRSFGHYIRFATRGYEPTSPSFRPIFGVTLNPGERFRWFFSNDGHLNDIGNGPKGKYQPHPLTQDATEANGAHGRTAYRQNRFYPDYGNGFLVFDGEVKKDNPAFTEVADDSFVYCVDVRYPVAHVSYVAPGAKDVQLSTDFGKSWRPLTCDDNVKGRSSYLVKVAGPGVGKGRFRAVTEVMMNGRVSTGKLRAGRNELVYSAFSGGEAEVTVNCRVPEKRLEVKGGVLFGCRTGEERQLVLLDPSKELVLDVAGAEAGMRADCPDLDAHFKSGRLILKTADATPRFCEVVLSDGRARRFLTVLVSPQARLAMVGDAEILDGAQTVPVSAKSAQATIRLEKKDSGARFGFEPLPAGSYMVFSVIRQSGSLKDLHNHPLVLIDPEDRRASRRRRQLGGIAASDYYKARFGRPGERGPFKWDYPTDEKTRYPFGKAATFKWKETSSVEFRLREDVPDGFEIAAVLVLPDADWDLYGACMKNFSGLNYAPGRVKED